MSLSPVLVFLSGAQQRHQHRHQPWWRPWGIWRGHWWQWQWQWLQRRRRQLQRSQRRQRWGQRQRRGLPGLQQWEQRLCEPELHPELRKHWLQVWRWGRHHPLLHSDHQLKPALQVILCGGGVCPISTPTGFPSAWDSTSPLSAWHGQMPTPTLLSLKLLGEAVELPGSSIPKTSPRPGRSSC